MLIKIFEIPVNNLMKKFGWHIKRHERSTLKEIDDKNIKIVRQYFYKMSKISSRYFGEKYLNK